MNLSSSMTRPASNRAGDAELATANAFGQHPVVIGKENRHRCHPGKRASGPDGSATRVIAVSY